MKHLWMSFVVFMSFAATAVAGEWVDLFDGKTLNGWSVHSGWAKYTVEDGCIVGSASEGSPNSFLCTDREYGDFVLEFEVKVDVGLNSGVQFRSIIAEEELTFPFDRWSVFRNLEVAGHRLQLDPLAVRSEYLARVRRFLRRLEIGCGQMDVDYVQLSTKNSFEIALAHYLAHRMSRAR